MAKTDTLFMTKMVKNHTLWDRTYLYSPYKGVPHPPFPPMGVNIMSWCLFWSFVHKSTDPWGWGTDPFIQLCNQHVFFQNQLSETQVRLDWGSKERYLCCVSRFCMTLLYFSTSKLPFFSSPYHWQTPRSTDKHFQAPSYWEHVGG